MGVGVAIFARDHRNLFRALFLEGRCGDSLHADTRERMLAGMDGDERLAALTREQKGALLDKMAIFTLGLATLICTDQLADTSEEAITAVLREMGAPAIAAAITAALDGEADRTASDAVRSGVGAARSVATRKRTGRKR
jgi:hypothetical protein